eukprot:1783990-Rhodomonas_salina.1
MQRRDPPHQHPFVGPSGRESHGGSPFHARVRHVDSGGGASSSWVSPEKGVRELVPKEGRKREKGGGVGEREEGGEQQNQRHGAAVLVQSVLAGQGKAIDLGGCGLYRETGRRPRGCAARATSRGAAPYAISVPDIASHARRPIAKISVPSNT